MMQKLRNRLPKLFRKNEKEKSPRQCDFDLANTFILLLCQKMQQMALAKKLFEQQRHAYYFKNNRRPKPIAGNNTNSETPLKQPQVVGDRQLTGGQRPTRVPLPPIPHTVNYSWLFDNEDNYKLNCFERAKIRDHCRQLTLDQSVLAYEIFLKRSEKITEPLELPKILDEILSVLLSRKPVRKNCMEAFKKRMESAPYERTGDIQLGIDELFTNRLPTKQLRLTNASTFNSLRGSRRYNNSRNNSKDASQEENSDDNPGSISSRVVTAMDKIRVVYVQSRGAVQGTVNKFRGPKKIRFEKKQRRQRDGDVGSLALATVDRETNEDGKLDRGDGRRT